MGALLWPVADWKGWALRQASRAPDPSPAMRNRLHLLMTSQQAAQLTGPSEPRACAADEVPPQGQPQNASHTQGTGTG